MIEFYIDIYIYFFLIFEYLNIFQEKNLNQFQINVYESLGFSQSRTCPNELFQCKEDFFCVSLVSLCDGILDCFDGSDENNCDFDLNFVCKDKTLQPSTVGCDHINHCADGSDEIFCGE